MDRVILLGLAGSNSAPAIPWIDALLSCGFPSPAADYESELVDLDNINWQPSSANSAKYKTVRDVACDMSTGRHPACQFELITDTKANFCLLGLSGEVVTTTINPKQFATTTSGVIVTSERHSAYCGKGFYDEYGTMLSISEFRSQHCIAFSCLLPNRDIQTVYSLK